jgi:hypothetical protein
MADSQTYADLMAEISQKIPEDLVPGFTVDAGDDVKPQTELLKSMKSMSKALRYNAFAYYNYTVRQGKLSSSKRKPRKVMSSAGFPPWVSVAYALPAPQTFLSTNETREVKHINLHSFGHMWAIFWMVSTKGFKGVQTFELDGKTVYVPKGSDEYLHHPQAFAAGVSWVLKPDSKAAAHFFIDRRGNLVVIGDVNDQIYCTNYLDRYGVGIELEEAFYVDFNPTKKNVPSRRNVFFAFYTPRQLLTLAVLCKKLETAFPAIRNRYVSFANLTQTSSSAPGYAMHAFAKQGSKPHLDVKPHFMSQEFWDSLFSLVDAQKHITAANIWKNPAANKYVTSMTGEAVVRACQSQTDMNYFTSLVTKYSYNTGLAVARSGSGCEIEKNSINTEAASQAQQESTRMMTDAADTYSASQASESSGAQFPDTNYPLDSEGDQAMSSDYW